MELEVLRCVRDWLDGTSAPLYGVNALIPSTPRDAGDDEPALFATFGDASRDQWVARQQWPRDSGITLPALVVFLAPPFTMPGEIETITRDAHPVIAIAQIAEDADSAGLRQDAYYRRRAIIRSLTQFNHPANAIARERNSVAMLVCGDITVGRTEDHWGDAFAIDGLQFPYLVRDHAP